MQCYWPDPSSAPDCIQKPVPGKARLREAVSDATGQTSQMVERPPKEQDQTISSKLACMKLYAMRVWRSPAAVLLSRQEPGGNIWPIMGPIGTRHLH